MKNTAQDEDTGRLANVWGDTVDLRHLSGAMVIGIALGFTFFYFGLEFIKSAYPELTPALQQAMALLIGIVGCLVAAVISAKLFPPKRVLNEQNFSEADRDRVLKELQVDMDKEAEYMKQMPSQILDEMRDLQLDEIFRKRPGDTTDEQTEEKKGE